MKNRLLSFLVLAVAVALVVAPVASADHCYRCSPGGKCRPAFPGGGAEWCDDITTPGVCVLTGWCVGGHPLTETEVPLGAEFLVAAVERLDDEPQRPASDPSRVAFLEAPQPAQR